MDQIFIKNETDVCATALDQMRFSVEKKKILSDQIDDRILHMYISIAGEEAWDPSSFFSFFWDRLYVCIITYALYMI